MGIYEMGSGDVVSAVCYTMYNIYLYLCTQTAETTSPEPFSCFFVLSKNILNLLKGCEGLKRVMVG